MGEIMEQANTLLIPSNHEVKIIDRREIHLSGIKKITSFDHEEFLMETTMGYMVIKGEELEMIKLDTYQGNVSIKGKINSMTYMESPNKKEKDDGVFSKLFK